MHRLLLVVMLLVIPVSVGGQSAPRPADPAPDPLPIRRVILYKTGIGYFEHLGRVRDRQDVTIRFTSAQLNDVLKSLTAIDLGQGQISGISYNSVAPLEQRLGALRLPLGRTATTAGLLDALRGARVEVTSSGVSVTGRLLSVERTPRGTGADRVIQEGFSIITDAGDLRTYDLLPGVNVRIVERDIRQEIGRYLDVVGSTREQDARSMVISTDGQGERSLFVSYVSEVPILKSTYRLVLPAAKDGKPLLQGWAVVDNTIGEDWTNVELSLVAGAPQSFIQQISKPFYGRRIEVPIKGGAQLTPQTHEETLIEGRGLNGTAPDQALSETVTITAESPVARANRLSKGVAGGVIGGVAGGIPAPPPPPAAAMPADAYAQLSSQGASAQAAALGDLFEYRIDHPVTLAKDQSALVPIVSANVDVEKVSLWNGASGSGKPLRAVWLRNTSGLTLDGGSMTIVDGNAFAGEGLVDPLQPGERRLISYAADLGTTVRARSEGRPMRVLRIRAHDGVIIQDSEQRATWTYTARNENDAPIALIVEHRSRPGWKVDSGQDPVESTAGADRFRLAVDAGKEAVLTVRETQAGESRISTSDVSEAWMTMVASAGVPAAELERALRPVLDRRAAVARAQERIDSLVQEKQSISADQQRVRENMKALRGSSEEKQLLQRYTRQLDEQEDRLVAIDKSMDQAKRELEEARRALNEAIASLSFDLSAAR
jgi:hypothetical protein